MTWNVWWRFGPQWRDRQQGIVQTIADVDPDVVGLQEVWGADGTTQVHEFSAALGMNAAFATSSIPPTPDPPENPDQAGVDMGVGLLSRWPIVSASTVTLPAAHRPPPVAISAALGHPVGLLRVVVANLEWEERYTEDRLAQARALADLAGEAALDGPLPVLLIGDMNAPPDGAVFRILTERLVDAWVAGGGDPGAVTLSSGHPFAPLDAAHLIDRRIDHILMRPGHEGQQVTVEGVVTAGDPVAGLDPSDHRAVVCDISWT